VTALGFPLWLVLGAVGLVVALVVVAVLAYPRDNSF